VAALLLLLPIFGNGYPPGVDAPTFLHLAWTTKLAITGKLGNPFIDPYWYGDFPYLRAYPPLAYGGISLLSTITSMPLEVAYRLLLYLAYAGTAVAVYWLALEFRAHKWAAFFAGLLLLSGYPMFMAMGAWGWFTSLFALPFALVAYGLLERSLRTGKRRTAAIAGLLFALSFLAHHMTAFAFALALGPWFIYKLAANQSMRRKTVELGSIFLAAALIVALPWAIAALTYLIPLGFRREIPGIWSFPLSAYQNLIFERDIIGIFTYPTYMGWIHLALATLGLVIVLLERGRALGPAIILLLFTWFSLGRNGNPLVNYFPFSGLDVARFSLFMLPFLALLGALALERLGNFAREEMDKTRLTLPAKRALLAALPALLFVLPAIDTSASRKLLAPTVPPQEVTTALTWLSSLPTGSNPLIAFGFRNYDTYLIPRETGLKLAHGWYDEGATNWRAIRQLRLMGFKTVVDPLRAHDLLKELNVGYIVIYNWNIAEGVQAFLNAFSNFPSLFAKRESWGKITVFELLP
jgi:hypothetical protein